MNWRLLRNQLVNCYHERPQSVAVIDHALAQVQEGLRLLDQMGHQFHLASGPQPPARAWPRLVFHLDHPKGFLCLCEEDFEFLGSGWFDTLDEAKHADGMGHQFKRGGVFPKKGLPVLLEEPELTRLDKERRNGLG